MASQKRFDGLGWVVPAVCGCAVALLVLVLGDAPGRAAQTPLSISISGNRFVNGDGQTVRLVGVDHPSFEYACDDGYAYDDGHMDDADAAAVASWNANAVRVPLNEDCWLGINGDPSNAQNPPPSPQLTQAGYQQAVKDYVAALHAHGLYAILDLHWSAPGANNADGQQPMPDDHSAAFWTSVATSFAGDPAVVFDVFNEPFSPTDPRSGDDPNPSHGVSWDCWVNGGCTPARYTGTSQRTATTYTAVGMQALVTAIRNTGARQPILVGGLDYANDLTGWVSHAPDDPLNQEAASFHNYMGKACDAVSCWNSQIAPVAANVPVVTGEFDEDNYAEPTCQNTAPSTFDQDFMTWADQHGVGYLAWGWWVLSQPEKDASGCSAFYLLDNYDGTPAAPNGTALHDHLLTLPPGGIATTTTTTTPTTTPITVTPHPSKPPPAVLGLFRETVMSGGSRVAFTLRSAESCRGTLTGQTVDTYAGAAVKRRRHRVSLGAVHFTLAAGKAKTVVLTLSKASRQLLAAKHTLRATITITLTSSAHQAITTRHTVSLKEPARHKRSRR
jgi:endoglucanase